MNKDGWQQHSYAACCGVADHVLWRMIKDNPHNKESVRVLEKCHFTYEGTLRKHARDRGDTLCYSILKEEWMEHRLKKQL